MALARGTRLGAYEILSPLGAGGMGEVYRARDTRLDRLVAIKILLERVANDPAFRERFNREARAISQLSHPHICTLHDIGETADGVRYLVMEHLDGDTLADRLTKGELPLDEALRIAVDVAEALSAAHASALVHRDLKPGNVMLTKSGAKLLDFGLATTAPIAVGDHSAAATLPRALTAQGAIAGTLQYMAPEQLDGRTVDARTDIFAFGALLYEMVTGKKAFEGSAPASVIGAIMSGTPPSMPAAAVSPALARVITTCLAKDPNDRWQSARDLARELHWLRDGGAELAPRMPRLRSRRLRRADWAVALAALAVVVAAAAIWVTTRRPAPAGAPTRMLVDLGVDASMPVEVGPNITLSPDGATLAFVALDRRSNISQLYVRRFDQLASTPVADTHDARNPFFSPDGQWIAFFDQANRKLKKISVHGGAPVTICDAPDARGGAWIDDDAIVFKPAPGSGSLLRVPASGGIAEPFVSAPQIEGSIRWPQMLPGNKAILYTSGVAAEFEAGVVVVQPVPSGTPKIVLRDAYYGRYVSTGHVLYVHEGTLFAVPFDADRLEITGGPVQIIEKIRGSSGTGGAEFVVSGTGTLAYVASDPAEDVISWLDRSGRATVLRSAAGIWSEPSFSPDGNRLAMQISDGRHWAIWTYDWAREAATKLTLDTNANSEHPAWTPAGTGLAFAAQRSGRPNLFWIRADGTGEARRLTESPNGQFPESWHPSGKFLAYTENRLETKNDLMLLPMSGDDASGWTPGTPTAFLSTPFDENSAMFSPDGRWIAYESNETGRAEIFVRAFPGGGSKVQVSAGGAEPRWSPAKHELLYRGPDNRIMAVAYSVDNGAFHAEKPRVWSPRPLPEAIIRPMQRVPFAVHPDGERIALAVPPDATSGARDKVVFVFNFFDELRRLAPASRR